jgi:hypothetical protein
VIAETSHGELHHLGTMDKVCGKNISVIIRRNWPSHKVAFLSLRRVFLSSLSRPNGFD